MICIRSSTGRSALCTDGHTAQAMPSGMPTIVERTIDTAISESVVIALDHMTAIPSGPPFGICRTPNDATISAAKSAVRHVPTSHATTVATTRTPTHVIQLRRSITQFVASFSRLAKPPITWCRKKFVCWLSVTQLLEPVEPARDAAAEHPVGREAAVEAARRDADHADHGGTGERKHVTPQQRLPAVGEGAPSGRMGLRLPCPLPSRSTRTSPRPQAGPAGPASNAGSSGTSRSSRPARTWTTIRRSSTPTSSPLASTTPIGPVEPKMTGSSSPRRWSC